MKATKGSSRKKSLNVVIPLVVYPFDVMISFGQTDEQLKAALDTNGCEWDSDCELGPTTEGRTVLLEGNQTILRLRRYPETISDYSTLAHEIFHATDFILYRIGITLSRQSDEAYAYLIGYLTKEIYKRIKF